MLRKFTRSKSGTDSSSASSKTLRLKSNQLNSRSRNLSAGKSGWDSGRKIAVVSSDMFSILAVLG